MSDTPVKYCYKCKRTLPIEQFPKNRSKKDGHATECHACNRERVARYRQQHPDKVRTSKLQWQKNNPEKRQVIQARYQANNADRIRRKAREAYWRDPERSRLMGRESGKRRYWQDPEKYRTYYREYGRRIKAEQPNWYKAWYANNRDKAKVYIHRRNARLRSLPDTLTESQWGRAIAYFDGCCAVCGRPQGLWHTLAADHWIPLRAPDCPGTVATNVVPLCHGYDGCNNSKNDRDAEEWLIAKLGKRKARAKLAEIAAYFDWVREQTQP